MHNFTLAASPFSFNAGLQLVPSVDIRQPPPPAAPHNILMAQAQFDPGQIFNELTKTFDYVKNMFAVDTSTMVQRASGGVGGEPRTEYRNPIADAFTSATGQLCFKTCGMEDMAQAMRDVSKLTGNVQSTLSTVESCLIAATIIFCVCTCVLTVTCALFAYKRMKMSALAASRIHRASGVHTVSSSVVYDADSIVNGNDYAEPSWSAKKKVDI